MKSKELEIIGLIVPAFGRRCCMQQVSEWKYLGDILSSNSKQDENIKERISRASGAAKEVKQMLDDLCPNSGV